MGLERWADSKAQGYGRHVRQFGLDWEAIEKLRWKYMCRVTLTFQSPHSHWKTTNYMYVYIDIDAYIYTFMYVEICKRFRTLWSGLQDVSTDLRESNKSLHFLSPGWIFSFVQRTNHLLLCALSTFPGQVMWENGNGDLQCYLHNCFSDYNHTTRCHSRN